MDTLKLHDLEPSSIFLELRFLMTEKDIVNLLRIVTSWFDLTRTENEIYKKNNLCALKR